MGIGISEVIPLELTKKDVIASVKQRRDFDLLIAEVESDLAHTVFLYFQAILVDQKHDKHSIWHGVKPVKP